MRKAFVLENVVNWFPGHMAKGLRVMEQTLRKVDVIIEVRDARVRYAHNSHTGPPAENA